MKDILGITFYFLLEISKIKWCRPTFLISIKLIIFAYMSPKEYYT